MMAEATSILAAVYVSLFIIAGGRLLTIAFGPAYHGLDGVVAWLAAMWAMRMLQAVPGMALMAAGETKPFLIAGLIRASVLPIIFHRAAQGASLEEIAAIGCIGESLSLLYVALRLQRLERGLCAILLSRAIFLIPAAVTASLAAYAVPGGLVLIMTCASAMALGLLAIGVGVMPSLRALLRSAIALRSLQTQP